MVKFKNLFKKKEPEYKPDRRLEEQVRQKYGAFRRLLADNQEVMEIITDLEEKYHGDYLFDMQYLRANIRRLSNLEGKTGFILKKALPCCPQIT
jgi:hypothetical protein